MPVIDPELIPAPPVSDTEPKKARTQQSLGRKLSKTPRLTAEHLTEIRKNTDWRRLFETLQLQKDAKKSREDDWWSTSPFHPDEKTASFHINESGFYCFATGQGGGPIELVQRLFPTMTCYDAGRWLLEHGVSRLALETRSEIAETLRTPSLPKPCEEPALPETINPAIRQDLRPALDPTHPAFVERGIPPEVLVELGAGFWQRKRPKKSSDPDPMNGRLVFQIRAVREGGDGSHNLETVILSHIGRAVIPEQSEAHGKWTFYRDFKKSHELYNIDLALLHLEAIEQAQKLGHILVVEGCFDVAKLWTAGVKNVVATFGAHLCADQIPRFRLIADRLGVKRFLVWYDRDQDGRSPNAMGTQNAVQLLQESGFEADAFDWEKKFPSDRRGHVGFPSSITDPAEFSVEQVRWLRERRFI